MSNSLNSLLERMRQGSVTQGWGAISVFSRSRLNQLLEQQYIERFESLAFLPHFMGDIGLDERQTDTINLAGIQLGAPLLSFDTASLSNSRATLTMNIVAGRYSALHRPRGLSSVLASTFNITEAMGFKLTLAIDLSMVLGEIDRRGKVTLNLSRGVNFHCNLAGEDASANQRVADFFRQEFEQLPAHRSVFELGMLDLKGYNNLTPTSFRLLTQAAPGAKVRGANNFGDGGVVVFIRLRASSGDGNFPPNGDFPFLIPDDRENDRDKYSATLILAEDMLPYAEDERLEVLNNLLFPGANAFQEVERHQPHDLAVFGDIAPTRTSISLTPTFRTIKAGQSQRFVLHDWQGASIQADSWQALSLQSHTPQGHGSIDGGLYTAPSATDIGHDTLRVVVTATYENAGKTYTASALLLVAFDDVAVAPRVATEAGGNRARPMYLSASTLSGGAVNWALRQPQYGELSVVGNGAVFSPDARSGKKGLVVQQVEAQGAETKEISLLLINAEQMLRIDPPYIPRLAKSVTVPLRDDRTLLPGLERRWKVIGGGGSVDTTGRFTAAASGVSSSSVVSCEIVRNGVVFSSGYSVIEVSELIEEPTWTELASFTIRVPGGEDRGRLGKLFPNGYQQLMVEIKTETVRVGGESYPLSATEKASMRLVEPHGQEIAFVDAALDGIPEGDQESWRVRQIPNRFQLAIQGAATQDSPNSADPVTLQKFYLHSRASAGAVETFYAKFQADGGRWMDSTQLVDINSTVEITPRPIPQFDQSDYVFEPTRVNGGGGNPTAEAPPEGAPDDPFDFHLTTVDYWKLSCRLNGFENISFETLEFLPVSGSTINTSIILWESEQLAETMFSWTGYVFDDPQKDESLEKINFDIALPDIVKDKELLDVSVNQTVFERGKLIISLHRSDDVDYVRAGDKSRDKLSRDLAVLLIDKQGNAHKRRISFLPATIVGRRNRLMHTLFTPAE